MNRRTFLQAITATLAVWGFGQRVEARALRVPQRFEVNIYPCSTYHLYKAEVLIWDGTPRLYAGTTKRFTGSADGNRAGLTQLRDEFEAYIGHEGWDTREIVAALDAKICEVVR